jgi:hypothetical protein
MTDVFFSFGGFMPLISFCRSLFFVAVWCVALAVSYGSVVCAAEFKPFLKIQTAGPNALITIVERAAALLDADGSLGMREAMQAAVPYKNLPGVNATGKIGLALQINEESPIGVDAILVLPISNFNIFNLPTPEWGAGLMMLKTMMKREGTKYTLDTAMTMGIPVVAYQKQGFFVIATGDADKFAANVDPKQLFSELENFAFGAHINFENISEEAIEMALNQIAMFAAMQEFDSESLLELSAFEDYSALTLGLAIDPRTLDLTASTQITPKSGSEMADKFSKAKNAQTMFGGFLSETPQTVFSMSYLDYLTDSDLKEWDKALELIREGFMQGLYEVIEEGEEGERITRLVEMLMEWIEESKDYYAGKRTVDIACSLAADGLLFYAEAIDKPNLREQIYELMPLLLGEAEGAKMQTLMDSNVRQDYETVAGFSLSLLPLMIPLPEETQDTSNDTSNVQQGIPVLLYWAVKEGEAFAVAISLGSIRTEQALKDALEKTATPVRPKQTLLFALKPLGEFLQNRVINRMEQFGMDASFMEEVKQFASSLVAADASTKITMTTEFPGDTCLYQCQIKGNFFSMIMRPAAVAANEAAKRMQCSNHIKQIMLAFHNYHDTHNALPPLYTIDANGKPLHSWRVLILPFIGQNALYSQIRLDEPWDSEYNKQFHNRMPGIYKCPSNPGNGCTYSVIAGEAFVAATEAGKITGKNFGLLQDGTSNTLAIVEIKQPCNWMDPTADIDLATLEKGINTPNGRAGSFHANNIITIGLFDGSVRIMPQTIDIKTLRALATLNDGAPIEWW